MQLPGNGDGNLDMSLTFHVHLCLVFARPQVRVGVSGGYVHSRR